jgi:hypothetical protein
MKNKWKYVIALGVVFITQTAWAVESGTMLKADELKAEPFRDANTVKRLAAGEKVEIESKDGGWLKVKTGKSSGWVRMLSVRKGDATKSATEATGLLNLASGRAGTGKVVATTGIRGLNEEELKAAHFDEQELRLSESYTVNKSDAQKFALQGKLVSRSLDYLQAGR